MIFGFVKVEGGAVNTHRDSYLLESLSVVSVRKPFLAAGFMLSGCFAGFSMAFADLLKVQEIITILGLSLLAVLFSSQIGQLKLLSRDLRGSELSGVIWGRYASLNRIRSEIVRALGRVRGKAQS